MINWTKSRRTPKDYSSGILQENQRGNIQTTNINTAYNKILHVVFNNV